MEIFMRKHQLHITFLMIINVFNYYRFSIFPQSQQF